MRLWLAFIYVSFKCSSTMKSASWTKALNPSSVDQFILNLMTINLSSVKCRQRSTDSSMGCWHVAHKFVCLCVMIQYETPRRADTSLVSTCFRYPERWYLFIIISFLNSLVIFNVLFQLYLLRLYNLPLLSFYLLFSESPLLPHCLVWMDRDYGCLHFNNLIAWSGLDPQRR